MGLVDGKALSGLRSESMHIVNLDDAFAQKLGFTSDKFDGYLWKHGDFIYISFIISKQPNKGHLRQLFQKIEALGLGIKVPTPFARMKEICVKNGFKQTSEWFPEAHEHVEVMVKEVVGVE